MINNIQVCSHLLGYTWEPAHNAQHSIYVALPDLGYTSVLKPVRLYLRTSAGLWGGQSPWAPSFRGRHFDELHITVCLMQMLLCLCSWSWTKGNPYWTWAEHANKTIIHSLLIKYLCCFRVITISNFTFNCSVRATESMFLQINTYWKVWEVGKSASWFSSYSIK